MNGKAETPAHINKIARSASDSSGKRRPVGAVCRRIKVKGNLVCFACAPPSGAMADLSRRIQPAADFRTGRPVDGVWLLARYLSSGDDPAMVGEEEMIFAQDVVEVR